MAALVTLYTIDSFEQPIRLSTNVTERQEDLLCRQMVWQWIFLSFYKKEMSKKVIAPTSIKKDIAL